MLASRHHMRAQSGQVSSYFSIYYLYPFIFGHSFCAFVWQLPCVCLPRDIIRSECCQQFRLSRLQAGAVESWSRQNELGSILAFLSGLVLTSPSLPSLPQPTRTQTHVHIGTTCCTVADRDGFARRVGHPLPLQARKLRLQQVRSCWQWCLLFAVCTQVKMSMGV